MQFMNYRKKIVSLCAGVLITGVTGMVAETKPGYGISSWAGWKPGQVSRAKCPELRSVPLILKWDSLELTMGQYAFEEKLGKPLRAADEDGLYVMIKIYVGPDCPPWIYEQGVPPVITDREVNALGKKTDSQEKYPYYLHPEYKKHYFALIAAFGKYVAALPPELCKRIMFVQSAEGSTGDGSPYKGNPLDKQYDISKEAWNDFRRETWQNYLNAFPKMPIAVNSDSNENTETQFLLDHMEVIGLKMGMFSHGYVVSDNDKRLAAFQALEAEAKKRGKPVLTRGEMDGELFVMDWSSRNIPQALYWSGIFATHCHLDVWNVPANALTSQPNWPALQFFNKYAGHKDPASAPAAFCALRDGLDASDFDRFPATEFGGTPGRKNDGERYVKITKAFAAYGARMDDPKAAGGGGMINRKSKGSNDSGWGTLPGNYSRFLTQIDPGSGDVGRWNIDESIQGRFGRAFEHQSGKTQMRFRLDPGFGAKEVKVKVTYLDKGTGSWAIGLPEKKQTTLIQNTDSGQWKTKTVTFSEPKELVLNYESGDDTVFHLIEIER